MEDNLKQQIARLDNQLVMKAHYNLSSNEQKLVLFLASRIDTRMSDFNVQRVKIKEIERFFVSDKNKYYSSIYDKVDAMCDSITSKKITLPKGFTINGETIKMHRYLQWFTDIEPYLDEDGEISLKFQFAESLKGFLLQLQEYVKINLVEVIQMKGKYSIRMYQVFKAKRDKNKKFKKVSLIKYNLRELKAMLGVGDKYRRIQNFKDRVLDPMKKEINEYSKEISIDYKLVKSGRTVTGIEFSIKSKKDKKPIKLQNGESENYEPSPEDLNKLSFAKLKAYKHLTKFGVFEGIAYKRIIPTIKGAGMEGYEDIFCEEAIKLFKRKEKPKGDPTASAAVFVQWWTAQKIFDIKGDVFPQISDKVHAVKKSMSQDKLDNREMAKTMATAGDFAEWYRNKSK